MTAQRGNVAGRGEIEPEREAKLVTRSEFDLRIACDIGGTFTDFAVVDPNSGELRIHKESTTPTDVSQGVLRGLGDLLVAHDLQLDEFWGFVHGTTLVANALIERRGTKTGLITTEGFTDLLDMGREQLYNIYNIFPRFPEPLVPRSLRRGVTERVDRDGRVLIHLDVPQVREIAQEFRRLDVDVVAVCLLHAYRNPIHEQTIEKILMEEWPDARVTLSSIVCPEIREYERTCTTVANAYVQPLMGDYLRKLERGLEARGFRGRLYLMLSSGGTTSVDAAMANPIHLIESGSAAGAVAGTFFGSMIGISDLISFDMGGTTAKIALIRDGIPSRAPLTETARSSRFEKGSGMPFQIPSIELVEIGAGGGSIAWVDEVGFLRIGPESAGADPGPACYGLGGTEVTVTDADVVLGYIDPDYFLGGRMRLDREAAEVAVGRVAEKMGCKPTELAAGIHRMVNENMAAAAKIHVIERGEDPSKFRIVAFGGAGPLHAAGVSEILQVPEVICPLGAGVFSAIGLLAAPMSFEFAHSYLTHLESADWTRIASLYKEMIEEGSQILLGYGYGSDSIRVKRSVDGHYRGQLHQLSISLESQMVERGDSVRVAEKFEREYRRLYAYLPEESRIELVTLRAEVSGPPQEVKFPRGEMGSQDASPALKGSRLAYFLSLQQWVKTSVYDRYLLTPGMQLEGPAIMEERESTILLCPEMRGVVDEYSNLRLRWLSR